MRSVLICLLVTGLLVFSDGMSAFAQEVELRAPARTLSYHHEARTLVASCGLQGVHFLRLEGEKIVSNQFQADWPTLYAIPVKEAKAFLLLDRMGKLRLVEQEESPDGEWRFIQNGEWPCEGIPSHGVRKNGKVYIASGASGLLIYDWQKVTEEPQLTGRFPFVDFSKEVFVFPDNTLLLADNWDTGLQVLDVSDAQRPTGISITPMGYVDSVVSVNQYAAVASRAYGFGLFDITDKSSPKLVNALPLPGSTRGLMANGVAINEEGLILACLGTAGVWLCQVETPAGGEAQLTVLHKELGKGITGYDAIFLPENRIAISTLEGSVVLREISRD